jgi:iron complex outermembrane receptor protein
MSLEIHEAIPDSLILLRDRVMKRLALFLLTSGSLILTGPRIFAQEEAAPAEAVLDSLLNATVNYSLFNTQVTSGAKYGQLVQQVPASVSIVSSEDIDRYGYRTLDDVFKSLSGFFVSNDRNYTYVGIRGFGRPSDYNSRLLLLVNGHTMNENVFGSAVTGNELGLDLFPFERIEVVRGPGSALYGTGAMFGVVNLVTKKGNLIDGVHIGAEAGSFGRRQVTVTVGTELADRFDFLFHAQRLESKGEDLYFKEYDTPETNNGISSGNDGDRSWGTLAALTYKGFSLQSSITSREKDIPTGSYGTVFISPVFKNTTRAARAFLELKYEETIGIDKKILVRGYLDDYEYRGTWIYDRPTYDKARGSWGGGEGQFLWDVLPANRLVIGGEYRKNWHVHYSSWDASTLFFTREIPFSLHSLYLQDEAQIGQFLSVTLGLRHDSYSTLGPSTMPRGAIVFRPTKSTSIKFGYGEAFRTPNFNEVNYEDEVSRAKGNPFLKPEEMQTTELILEHRISDAVSGSLSLYHYRMMDLIDQVVDPADSFSQYQNKSSVWASGAELEVRAKFPWGQRMYASYSRQETQDEAAEEQLTNSPKHLLKIGTDVPILETASAAMEMLYESERLTLGRSTTKGYFLANVNLSAQPWRGHLTCSMRIRNVFNTPYESPGGFEHHQNAIIQERRSLIFRTEITF